MVVAALLLTFYGNNINLLKPPVDNGEVAYPLNRRASIKDIIESLGVPHTEVGRIELNGRELAFQHIPAAGDHFHIFSFGPDISLERPTLLRPGPPIDLKFMVDINVRKLARNLRITGIDTSMVPEGKPRDIAMAALSEKRILLTRNRELLKLSDIAYGQLLRSQNHFEQLVEIADRFSLRTNFKPFSRCLACNGILAQVAKADVIDRLKPLTKKYYTEFKQCQSCQKVYWKGSHHAHLLKVVNGVETG